MSVNWSDLQLMLQKSAEVEKIQQLMRQQYQALQNADAKKMASEQEERKKHVEAEKETSQIRANWTDDRRQSQARDEKKRRDEEGISEDNEEDGKKHIDFSV